MLTSHSTGGFATTSAPEGFGLEEFERAGLRVRVIACGARFSLLFGLDRDPVSYRDLLDHDTATATRFYGAALDEGVYFHAAWHHGFSAMHTDGDLAQALEGIERAARRVAATAPAGATG